MLARYPNRKRWCRVTLSLLFISLAVTNSIGQEITPEEVKASYILKIRSFVALGKPAHQIQKICYYEKPGVPAAESVGQILAKYAKQNAEQHGAPLGVEWFKAIRDFSNCDVFFIPADEDGNIDNILTAIGSAPTLTISAAKRFIFRGGMIGFDVDDAGRVKMEGNLKNMRANNVAVDAQILEIMQRVEGQ